MVFPRLQLIHHQELREILFSPAGDVQVETAGQYAQPRKYRVREYAYPPLLLYIERVEHIPVKDRRQYHNRSVKPVIARHRQSS